MKRSRKQMMTMGVPRVDLRHFDSRSASTVEQSPQVILCERVRWAFTDQRGEDDQRAWIMRLELREGVGIAQGMATAALLRPVARTRALARFVPSARDRRLGGR